MIDLHHCVLVLHHCFASSFCSYLRINGITVDRPCSSAPKLIQPRMGAYLTSRVVKICLPHLYSLLHLLVSHIGGCRETVRLMPQWCMELQGGRPLTSKPVARSRRRTPWCNEAVRVLRFEFFVEDRPSKGEHGKTLGSSEVG